jgi:septal ring factor EnvC (AmiA/AmiB activator)
MVAPQAAKAELKYNQQQGRKLSADGTGSPQAQLAAANKQVHELEGIRDKLEAILADMEQQLKSLQQQYAQKQRECDQLQQMLQAAEQQLAAAAVQLQQREQQLAAATAEREQAHATDNSSSSLAGSVSCWLRRGRGGRVGSTA